MYDLHFGYEAASLPPAAGISQKPQNIIDSNELVKGNPD